MKVKAKRWINVDGAWHGTGEVFEVKSTAGFADAVEVLAGPKPEIEPKEQENLEKAIKEVEKAEKKAEEKSAETTTRRRNSRR